MWLRWMLHFRRRRRGRVSPYFTDDECMLSASRIYAEAVCLPGLSAQLFALETGLGIMVLNENHTALQNPHLIARQLEGLPTAEFCIAWHGANPNPAVQLFLQQL